MTSRDGRSSRIRLRDAVLAACILVLCVGGPADAQVCTGDCGGLGRVRISDLILAVNIVLGLAPLEQCAALGAAPVGINQLIASVNNALCACQACPTPPPPRSFTATPKASATATPTPTPTTSPTPAPTVSTWTEDDLKIPSSTCPKSVTDDIRQSLMATVSDYTVRQLGQQAELEDAEGNIVPATIDADGTLHAQYVEMQSQGACVVTADQLLTVNLSKTPTSARYAIKVSTMHCPRQLNCTLQVTGRWSRTSAARRARGSVLGAVRAALRPSP